MIIKKIIVVGAGILCLLAFVKTTPVFAETNATQQTELSVSLHF